LKLEKLKGIDIINNYLKGNDLERKRRAAAIICNVCSGIFNLIFLSDEIGNILRDQQCIYYLITENLSQIEKLTDKVIINVVSAFVNICSDGKKKL
jgi:hypothetical protein